MGYNIQGAFSGGGGGGGATVTAQEISPTHGQTTTSTTIVDVSGGSIVLADETDGKAFCNFYANIENTDASNQYNIGFELDGVNKNVTSNHSPANNLTGNVSISQIFDTGGETLQLRWLTAGGTATLANDSYKLSRCVILEVA